LGLWEGSGSEVVIARIVHGRWLRTSALLKKCSEPGTHRSYSGGSRPLNEAISEILGGFVPFWAISA